MVAASAQPDVVSQASLDVLNVMVMDAIIMDEGFHEAVDRAATFDAHAIRPDYFPVHPLKLNRVNCLDQMHFLQPTTRAMSSTWPLCLSKKRAICSDLTELADVGRPGWAGKAMRLTRVCRVDPTARDAHSTNSIQDATQTTAEELSSLTIVT